MAAQIWPDGYGSVKCLHRGAWGEVFSALRLADQHPVVLKIFGATEEGNEHARREFKALAACSHPGVPEALDLDLTCERPCLVLEHLSGVPLRAWIEASGPPPIEIALDLAISWAEILSAVHAARLVHRDVTPNNLLVDPETHETHLIDFGITEEVGRATSGSIGENVASGWAGTLQYIAPEQTGRMNRGISFQSDLYGFGGTLYYALTGQPPFLYDDPLELIHAHIARQPLAPSAIREDVPEPLGRLVLKLLSKEPEERYASALSLRCDLEALRDQLSQTGDMDSGFQLEAISIPDRPRFSKRLFGRDAECGALWNSVVSSVEGGPRVVLLQGPPGVGKSALVETLRPRLGEINGYLIQATLDPYLEWPYAGWVGCLESFAEQLLVESDVRLQAWRAELAGALGAIAGALTDLVPDLEAVLGEVDPVAELGAKETRARLRLVLQRFFAAAATSAHPIIVFLDDFHHSDAGTHHLLAELFAGDAAPSVTVIVGCETSSDADGTGVPELRARLSELDVPVEELRLGPLSSNALLDLLEDTLGKSRSVSAPLASHIERKTGCNPLWVRQLIEHLHSLGLLRFQPGEGWIWDLDEIAGASVPDGAIGLLVAKLEGLAPELGDVLSWASCAGASFDSALLERLGGRGADTIQRNLLELEAAGLVLPCPDGFRFAHDRVRDAAKERLCDEDRAVLHAEVAGWLLEQTAEKERTDRAFEIADHLVRAGSALPRELRTVRIEICLSAGRQALRSGASVEARRFLDVARAEFGPEDWRERQALGFGLWLASADATHLAGDLTPALELLDEVEPYASSDLERARVEMQRIQVLALVKPPGECAEYALGVLRRYGVRWKLHPPRWQVLWTLRRCYTQALERARLGVRAPAATPSQNVLAAITVITAAGGPMSRTDSALAAMASCFVIRAGLPARLNSREAYSAGNYALWLQVLMGDSKRAAEMAEAALRWLKDAGDSVHLARLEVTTRACLQPHWTRRRRALAGLDQTADQLLENGDIEFSYYARFLKVNFGALAGDPTSVAKAQLSALVESVRRVGTNYREPARVLNAYKWLCDTEYSPQDLEDAVAEAERWGVENSGSIQTWETTIWMLVTVIFGRPDLAFTRSERLGATLYRTVPYVQVAHHLLYRGLAASALAEETGQRSYRRALKDAAKRLERWAAFGPDFPHMFQLLKAEEARLAGKLDQAHRLYEQAARGALSQEFVNHAALAKERRGGLLIQHRRATEARDVLAQAVQLYDRWGVQPKVAALLEEHAGVLSD